MSEKKVGKRLLTWVLVLVMTLSLLPLNVLAEEGDDSPSTSLPVYGKYVDGEWEKDDSMSSTINNPAPNVDYVTKEATPTGNPNEYNIKLEVKMHTTSETVSRYDQAATVLVIDTSGSMNYCTKEEHKHDINTCYVLTDSECDSYHYYDSWKWQNDQWYYDHGDYICIWNGNRNTSYRATLNCNKVPHVHGSGCDSSDSRLIAAQTAAKNFLESYAKDAQEGSGRYVALVTFAKKASASDLGWVDVSYASNRTELSNAIDALSANGGTNLDDGLQTAEQLFNKAIVSAISSQNIIALTDGKPTYCWGTNFLGNKTIKGDGKTCTDTIFKNTAATAAEIQNRYSLYSICFGAGNEILDDPYTNTQITLAGYLNTYIAPGKTYTATDLSGLERAFGAISDTITSGLSSGKVHDSLPIGVACTDIPNGSVDWDLSTFDKKVVPQGEHTTYYIYTKTYTVTINPSDDSNFLKIGEETYCPLNGETTLTVEDKDGNNITIDFPIPAGRVTLPKPEKYTYTLSYDANGATCDVPQTQKFEDTTDTSKTFNVDTTTKLVREGYTFLGWSTDQNATSATYFEGSELSTITLTAPDCTKVLYAVWQALPKYTYTLSYNANGGSGAPEKQEVKDTTETSNTFTVSNQEPTREGYKFLGWATSSSATEATIKAGDEVIATKDAPNKTIYAVWQQNKYTYTLTYDANGGSGAPDKQEVKDTTETSNTFTVSNQEPTREGYKFLGWSTSNATDATVNVGETVTVTKDEPSKTIHAVWQQNKYTYTLTYDANGGSGAPDQQEVKDSTETSNAFTVSKQEPTREGYKFLGWSTSNATDATVNVGETVTVTKDEPSKTIHAVWQQNKYTYTLTYDANGGSGAPDKQEVKDSTETSNTFTVSNQEPTREGYKFLGWSTSNATDATVNVGETVTVTKDEPSKTIHAVWQQNKYTYTLTYDANGGSGAPDKQEVKDSTDASMNFTVSSTKPSRDGYTFLGWATTKDATTSDVGETVTVTKDAPSKTIYAVWKQNTYTVKFESNGGSTVADQKVNYNDNATKPTNPTRSGYTFDGWYDKELKNTYNFGTPVTADITLYAKWNTNYVPYYPPVPPTVKIEDDDALGLNTTDHFAYIVGYGNGEVRPQNNITRAEVATIFFRLLTDDVRDENLTKTNRYSDVAATAWYNTAVSTLSSMGIITGYPDGTFRPNAAITRAEFAAIAARFDHDGDKTAAKFSDIATHWAKDEISIAYNNGWITGYPDGTFGPQRDITRAETMTLVNRVLNRQPETEEDLLPNMTVWTDNANPKAWYYLAVQEATNSHYYKFKTNSKYEKWTELRETRDWTQLEK